jgi:hypothetical protein
MKYGKAMEVFFEYPALPHILLPYPVQAHFKSPTASRLLLVMRPKDLVKFVEETLKHIVFRPWNTMDLDRKYKETSSELHGDVVYARTLFNALFHCGNEHEGVRALGQSDLKEIDCAKDMIARIERLKREERLPTLVLDAIVVVDQLLTVHYGMFALLVTIYQHR